VNDRLREFGRRRRAGLQRQWHVHQRIATHDGKGIRQGDHIIGSRHHAPFEHRDGCRDLLELGRGSIDAPARGRPDTLHHRWHEPLGRL
jgi:hypothetical protein